MVLAVELVPVCFKRESMLNPNPPCAFPNGDASPDGIANAELRYMGWAGCIAPPGIPEAMVLG